jgi:hypothetical protein
MASSQVDSSSAKQALCDAVAKQQAGGPMGINAGSTKKREGADWGEVFGADDASNKSL